MGGERKNFFPFTISNQGKKGGKGEKGKGGDHHLRTHPLISQGVTEREKKEKGEVSFICTGLLYFMRAQEPGSA